MFHAKLKQLMKEKKKSPRDFYANRNPILNISKGEFYKILNGEHIPQVHTINNIALVLGVDSSVFYEDSYESYLRERKEESDFDKFLEEEFDPAFDNFIKAEEKRQLRANLKFGLICFFGGAFAVGWTLFVYIMFNTRL